MKKNDFNNPNPPVGGLGLAISLRQSKLGVYALFTTQRSILKKDRKRPGVVWPPNFRSQVSQISNDPPTG